MGSSEVWLHPRQLLLRRKGLDLERAARTMVEVERARIAYCQWYVVSSSWIFSRPDRFLPLVNSISWAPHELGAILSCASSDGKISVLTFKSTRLLPYALFTTS